jgi:hypothetical protein
MRTYVLTSTEEIMYVCISRESGKLGLRTSSTTITTWETRVNRKLSPSIIFLGACIMQCVLCRFKPNQEMMRLVLNGTCFNMSWRARRVPPDSANHDMSVSIYSHHKYADYLQLNPQEVTCLILTYLVNLAHACLTHRRQFGETEPLSIRTSSTTVVYMTFQNVKTVCA